MIDAFSLAISTLSLAIASLTAWLTLFRRGTIKMTQPTVIYFGPDKARSRDDTPPQKIYLRTLLFSTSKRGRVLESMHVALSRNETRQNFNVWVYGERNKLVRGSGLFVGETGVAADHHFLAPVDDDAFHFTEGRYRLDIFVKLLGDSKPIRIFSQLLYIERDLAIGLKEKNAGLYFDWGPDASGYLSHLEKRPPSPNGGDFLQLLAESDPTD